MDKEQTAAPQLPGAFELFKPSYEALMVNIWTFLGLVALPMAGLLIGTMLLGGNSEGSATSMGALQGVGALIAVASGLLTIIIAPAMPLVQIKSTQGKQITIGEALQGGLKFFWRFWGLSILVGLIIIVGFLLLIVPGIFMIKRYYLAPFYMYDKNTGIGEAMRTCAEDSKAFAGAIWGVIGVTLLINLPSIIPLFAIVTMVLSIVYYCAPTLRYFQIKSAKKKR